MLFILHLIPCSRFNPCPSQPRSVPWEADPGRLRGPGAPWWRSVGGRHWQRLLGGGRRSGIPSPLPLSWATFLAVATFLHDYSLQQASVLHSTRPCWLQQHHLTPSALNGVRASDYCQPLGPDHPLLLPKLHPCLVNNPSIRVSTVNHLR